MAWVVTADRMQGMDAGPGTDLGSFGWFAGIWAVMMAAMMLPSLVPMAGAYAAQARGASSDVTPQSLLRTTLFTAGYLLTWVLVGVVAWLVFEAVRSLDISILAWDGGGRYVAGGVIAGAALYEFTPLKRTCLRHCRDRELLAADWREGSAGALRMGPGPRRLLRRLVVGADGGFVRARRDEHHLDGGDRGADRAGEGAALA